MPLARALPFGLIAGLASTLLIVVGTRGGLGGTIFICMSSLPVFLTGFGAGWVGVGTAILTGFVGSGLIAGAANSVVFGELVGVPALVLVSLTLAPPKPASAGRLTVGLTCLGLVAFGLVYAIGLVHQGGLQTLMQTGVDQALVQIREQSQGDLPVEAETLARQGGFWVTGVVIAFWVLLAVVNGILAQSSLVGFGYNLRPTPPLSSLSLPRVVSVSFALCLAAWLFGTGQVAFVGANLALILVVPLALGGLGVVHMAVSRYPARLLMLVGVYLVLCFIWPIALIVAIGVIEQWVGLRQHLAAGSNRGEK